MPFHMFPVRKEVPGSRYSPASALRRQMPGSQFSTASPPRREMAESRYSSTTALRREESRFSSTTIGTDIVADDASGRVSRMSSTTMNDDVDNAPYLLSLSYASTVVSETWKDEEQPVTPIADEKYMPKDPYLVDWDSQMDPENPRNWTSGYKSWITFQLSMMAMAGSMGSSIIAPANREIARYIGVSFEATVLTVSLYVLGFAVGPSIWGPLAELHGRKWSMLPAMFCLGLFSLGTATAKNAETVFITRFFAGVFGSAPVSNVSAALGDMYTPRARGTAAVFYAVAVVGGPTLGPVIGSALVANKELGWRWTEYIEAIWVFAVFALTLVCMPEMFGPVLLKQKTRRLRKETGIEAWHHPHESMKLTPRSIFTKHFSRPIVMLFTEPMILTMTLYASFVYSLLYLTLEVFPIVFQEQRGWGPVVGSLPFLGLFVGVCSAILINLGNIPRYARIAEAAMGRPVPEARLAPMAVGGFLYAIGLFWFGWTADPKISWVAPVAATVFIGAGFNIIFQQIINFIVDTYGLYAASALAANTLMRSAFAAGFPLVAGPMFHSLGVGPAMSILGAFATLAIPLPFVFMKYGMVLRTKSRYNPDMYS